MKRGFVGKRAQVGIIALILLILISLVAVMIVWNLVGVLVGENSENIDAELIGVELEVKDVAVFVTGASKVSVARKAGGGEIDGLKVVLYDDGGNSEVKEVDSGLKELETKTFSFSPVEVGKIKKVSVYPVFKNNIGREFKADVKKVIEMPESLVSWWRFDDADDFVDDNDGAVIGGEIIEGVLRLDGNSYFSVSDDSSLNFNEGISVSVWVNGNSNGEIIDKGENYRLFLRNKKIVFSYNGKEFESFEEIEEGWNHISVSADFDGIFKMFVRGNAASDFVSLEGGVASNNGDLRIGSGFAGEIDEVMIFNKDLSVEQIEGLYGFGRG